VAVSPDDPKCIIVVDDELSILTFTSSILTAAGYTVIPAHSGMDAMEQSRGREADIALLLTDVVMPDLNGPHLAERLLTRIPTLRVLFMSGWEPQVIAHEGAFRRGYRTLLKPFTAAGLLEAVEQALQETGGSQSNKQVRPAT
jgi:two-component system, cell cycle sensor histidine kinase and response regulator CckA